MRGLALFGRLLRVAIRLSNATVDSCFVGRYSYRHSCFLLLGVSAMKAVIDRAKFLEAFARAAMFTVSKNAKPELGYVLFNATGESVSLRATDLECSVVLDCMDSVSVESRGAVNALAAAPDGTVVAAGRLLGDEGQTQGVIAARHAAGQRMALNNRSFTIYPAGKAPQRRMRRNTQATR